MSLLMVVLQPNIKLAWCMCRFQLFSLCKAESGPRNSDEALETMAEVTQAVIQVVMVGATLVGIPAAMVVHMMMGTGNHMMMGTGEAAMAAAMVAVSVLPPSS